MQETSQDTLNKITVVLTPCLLLLSLKSVILLYHFSRFSVYMLYYWHILCQHINILCCMLFDIYMLIYNIYFSLSDLLCYVWLTLGPFRSLKMTQYCSFSGWVVFLWRYVEGWEEGPRRRGYMSTYSSFTLLYSRS